MGTLISFVWMSILEARELLEKGLRGQLEMVRMSSCRKNHG